MLASSKASAATSAAHHGYLECCSILGASFGFMVVTPSFLSCSRPGRLTLIHVNEPLSPPVRLFASDAYTRGEPHGCKRPAFPSRRPRKGTHRCQYPRQCRQGDARTEGP